MLDKMTRTVRRLAALLALIALSLSAVEKGWAAACTETGSLSSHAVTETGDAHSQHIGPAGLNWDGGGDMSQPSSSCPMAAASGMACGAVAVVAPAASPLMALNTSTEVPPAPDQPVGNGALSYLFRPPQQ
jgi:hypothetical protein